MTGLMAHTDISPTSARGNWSLNSHQCPHHCLVTPVVTSPETSPHLLLLLLLLLPGSPGVRRHGPAQEESSSHSHDESLAWQVSLISATDVLIQTKQECQGVARPVQLEVGVVVEADGILKRKFLFSIGSIQNFQA